jgi:hypothetical protein
MVKTIKKPAQKKRNILSKINLQSPKTRGLVLVLAFALVGGGVLVFRSFAATSARLITTSANDGTLICAKGTGCSLIADGDAKAGAKVISFDKGGTIVTQSIFATTKGIYKVCVTAKGQGGLSIAPAGASLLFTNANSYETKCSNELNMNANTSIWSMNQTKGGNVGLKVSIMTVDQINASTTPVVSSTCTKNCTQGK